MTIHLIHAKYDRKTERAYVELRQTDDDGGEQLAVAIFSYRNTQNLTGRQIEPEIVRKARHIFQRAAKASENGKAL